MSHGHPPDKGRELAGIWWVVVVSQTLLKKPVDGMRALVSEHDAERLRLAVTGANEIVFDWTLGDDRIAWDGGLDVLVLHTDVDRLQRGVTEQKREAQRLTYLATRDELTGHLNRTSLRSELAGAIEAAKAEQRSCAYLVASIDRLATINEAYGFGAADEVILAVGERIAGVLRHCDIIRRHAGNKLR